MKASKLKDINDFIDCALFGVKYISIDSDYVLLKNKNKFGSIVSSVPMAQSNIVLESDTDLETLKNALCLCNPSILQINHDVDTKILKKYKESYRIWKLIKNKTDITKYSSVCDAFVLNYTDLINISNLKELSRKEIIIRAHDKKHISEIKDFNFNNVVTDVDYDHKHIYDFENNC